MTTDETTERWRYPIGRFAPVGRALTTAERREAIDALRRMPGGLREAVAGLDDAQLDTPYRPEGWTVRQVVHHVPDSHLNAYVRLRWALTEDEPLIKPYDENAWAALPDAREGPPEMSLRLLEAVHTRWVALWDALEAGDFLRTLRHPDFDEPLTLDLLLELYAWHGRHHTAHVLSLREREGW